MEWRNLVKAGGELEWMHGGQKKRKLPREVPQQLR
jgi:hypothetical protein